MHETLDLQYAVAVPLDARVALRVFLDGVDFEQLRRLRRPGDGLVPLEVGELHFVCKLAAPGQVIVTQWKPRQRTG